MMDKLLDHVCLHAYVCYSVHARKLAHEYFAVVS
jgi:hypothetical protein